MTQQPEALLAHYDVVFAKARAALEAMACGTAVIVCDAAGLAEMVTTDRMHALRRLNFGIRTLQRPVTVDAIAHELTRYDRDDAAKVAAFIRHDAGIDPVVDRLLQIYTESIANFPVPALRAMSRAASGYLRWLAPHVKTIGGLHQRLAQHEQEVAQHRHAVSARDQELQASAERVATLQQELQALETRLATADATARLRQSREQEVEHLQAALREIATSSTMQLRDRIVGLPLVGAAVRSLARSIARRRSH